MNPTKRMIINSGAQYIRTILYMALSLYSTRLILDALGKSDFGLYSLVGSVVIMFGFVTSSLATSTQRYLSYSWGQKDVTAVSRVFSNAMFLHTLICLVLTFTLLLLRNTIIERHLNIQPDRLESAEFIYITSVIILGLSFLNSPVKALFIARENIIFVSCVDVFDAFSKLLGAFALYYINYDSLKTYAIIMASISLFEFSIYLTYAFFKYEECKSIRKEHISLNTIWHMSSFALWNVYSVGSGVIRIQGIAVIINKFLGTIVNASYGIALQVYSASGALALAILNAINPQLMKAEGAGDRQRMLTLCTKESKYSFLVLSLLLIPIIVEMPSVLTFWLGDIPNHAVMFCRYILLALIVDQLTIGLTSANQALGSIRNYSVVTSTIRLLALPMSWFALTLGYPCDAIMWSYIFVELMIGVIRLPFLKITGGLEIMKYLYEVVIRCLPISIVVFSISYTISISVEFPFRFIITEIAGIITGTCIMYLISLDEDERKWFNKTLNRLSR
ncbi:MAG: MATE family efflux transporter [Prevotellaceae bacterium]|nr:MATE family efflux transporter [Prevotellaceae bacterium]